MKPTANPAEFAPILGTYCDLMTEIKIRERAIVTMLTTQSPVPAQVTYESCYLQFRLICELIALGCLAVHGDIDTANTKQMKALWNADQIMKRLSRVHPDFYPKPILLTRDGEDLRYEFVQSGYLTKNELLSLYNISCARTLHRGNIADMQRRFDPINVRFEEVEQWRQKVVRLLVYHWISVHGCPDQVAVSMNEVGTSPVWTYFKAIGHT